MRELARHAASPAHSRPARPGLGSASTGCSPGGWTTTAGGGKRSRGTSSGERWRAGAGSAVRAGGSAWSAAASRRCAALRSAVAASRMHRALTTGLGARSGSAVQPIQKDSPARASSACLSASAGAPWMPRSGTVLSQDMGDSSDGGTPGRRRPRRHGGARAARDRCGYGGRNWRGRPRAGWRALQPVGMSIRSPQGSRFQSPGGSE